MQSRSADAEAVEIHVKVDGELDGMAVAKQAMDALSDLNAMASSRTIAELRDISSLLRSAIPGALTDGWVGTSLANGRPCVALCHFLDPF
jgi:hypothetical protein